MEPVAGEAKQGSFEESQGVHEGAHVLLINVSPIEYGHVLLVPRVLE